MAGATAEDHAQEAARRDEIHRNVKAELGSILHKGTPNEKTVKDYDDLDEDYGDYDE